MLEGDPRSCEVPFGRAALELAWQRVEANRGAAGGDGVDLMQFASSAGWELDRLHERLRTGSYKPLPYREVSFERPGKRARTLNIPSVADRVVQTAIAQSLTPAAERRFDDASHGYRPRRGVHTALAASRAALDAGGVWVVDADIRRCFESIDVQRVLRELPDWGAEGRMLELIAQALQGAKGLQLGSPMSPLLCNIHLHSIDCCLRGEGIAAVRYADDMLLFAGTETDAQRAHAVLGGALAQLGLELHPEKTRVVSPGQAFAFLGEELVAQPERHGPTGIVQLAPATAVQAVENDPPPAELQADEPGPDDDGEAVQAVTGDDAVSATAGARTLYVLRQGVALRADGERLQVLHERAQVASIPIREVDVVMCFGNVAVTTGALHLALRNGTRFVLLERDGRLAGCLDGNDGRFLPVQQAQFRQAADPVAALELARGFVVGKISNSIGVLQRQQRRHAAAALAPHLQSMRQMREQARHVGTLEALRGIEGFAARSHFAAMRELIGSGWGFESRQRRPSPDPVNAMLSFGYTLLFRNVEAALAAHGLNRHLGFLHQQRSGHAALASDLIEEFRAPVVDSMVLHLVTTGRVRRQDFDTDVEVGCTMNEAAVRRYIAAFEARMGGDLEDPQDAGWRRAIDRQVRHLVATLRGRADRYVPMRAR